MMTKEEQREAIAQKVLPKWSQLEKGVKNDWFALVDTGWITVPNYPEDLNAIHEAERVLNGDEVVKYINELGRIHETFCIEILNPADVTEDWQYEMSKLVMTTASQRSEAFCRVFWPERWTQ